MISKTTSLSLCLVVLLGCLVSTSRAVKITAEHRAKFGGIFQAAHDAAEKLTEQALAALEQAVEQVSEAAASVEKEQIPAATVDEAPVEAKDDNAEQPETDDATDPIAEQPTELVVTVKRFKKDGSKRTPEELAAKTEKVIAKLVEKGIDAKHVIVAYQGQTRDRVLSPEDAALLQERMGEVNVRKGDTNQAPLKGGLNSGTATMNEWGGTLGAFFMETLNLPKHKGEFRRTAPVLYPVSNQHVFHTADGADLTQPATKVMKDFTDPTCVGAACVRKIAKKVVGAISPRAGESLDGNLKPQAGHIPSADIAMGNLTTTLHARCSIRLIGAVTGKHPAGEVPNKAVKNIQNMQVLKSGYRTHLTAGYVQKMAYEARGTRSYGFRIASRSLPKFVDPEATTEKVRIAAGTAHESTEVTRTVGETEYIEDYLVSELKRVHAYTTPQAAEIAAKLVSKKMVTLFSMPGDSGSFIVSKKKRGKVLGVMDSGFFKDYYYSGYNTAPPAGAPLGADGNPVNPANYVWDPYQNKYWRAYTDYTHAFTIYAAETRINQLVAAAHPGKFGTFSLCTEKARKMHTDMLQGKGGAKKVGGARKPNRKRQ